MTAPMRPRIIERLGRVAPLGVRFRDAITATDVVDLTVEAWPIDEPRRRVRAFVTAGGVYGWLDLPGLRERTFGAGDDEYWRTMDPPRSYRVEVVDPVGRFLPFRFTVRAPTRGVLPWTCDPSDSPPNGTGAVPLYSAASRLPPAATAVIRAEIHEADPRRPAAWAVVEARSGGRRIGRGMADHRGRLMLLAHYPEPLPPPLAAAASPPRPSQVPLWNQEWPVQLDVFYAARATGDVVTDPPDLCEALLQPLALVWRDDARRAALGTVMLRYGEELRVRTDGERARGALLVTRTDGGSPP